MCKFKTYGLFISCLILFTTCKKEIDITQNPNQFGAIFGSGGYLDLSGAIRSEDNNYLLYGTITNKANKSLDGFVMKVDENFNIIWNKTFGGSNDDYFNSLTLDESGNIMAVGNSSSFGTSVDSSYKFPNSRFYMVYMDKNGNTLWEKTFQANGKPGNKNFYNNASKVLYLNNGSFGIAGTTGNFRNNVGSDTNYTKDVFAFGIDKQANIKWQKRFYDTILTANSKRQFDESCFDAELTNDGNIMLLMTHYYNDYLYITLMKVTANDTGFNENKYIWKGPQINDLTSPFQGPENLWTPPMEILNGDKMIFYDDWNGGIALADESGKLISRKPFKYEIWDLNFTKNSKDIMALGRYQKGSDAPWLSFWATLDMEGNIISETYTTEELTNYAKTKFFHKNIFITPNRDVLIFSTANTLPGLGIIMLKYDEKGNLIKTK